MEKQRKLKVIILSTLIIGVLTLTIAFSAISRTLDIVGVGKMDTATWDVHFENLSDATITRDAIEINKPNISLDKGTVENINVKLTKPKDEIKYVVDIVNKGTINAEVNVMTISELTDEEKKLIDFGVYYLNGSKIVKYDVLEPGEEKSVVIKIRYKDDITEFDLPCEPLTINLSCQIEYVQSDSEIVIIPNESLENVTSVLAGGNSNSSTSTFFNGTIKKETIESISFLSTLNVPQNSKLTAWDASLNKDGSVVAWYTDIDNNDLYELYIGGNGKVYAPQNSSNLFKNFTSLKEINFNNNFDTSNVVDISYMFENCYKLVDLDLSSWNTSKVTTMSRMFSHCSSLTSLDLSSFNTSNVTTISGMFSGCSSLTSLDVSNFNTSNVTDMSQMFIDCSNLISLDLNNFNTSNVTNMSSLFMRCALLTSIDLSTLSTSKVTDMSHMFSDCKSLKNINFGNFNTTNVTDMSMMFYECHNLTNLDLSSFDTTKLKSMYIMFGLCKNLKQLDLSNFNTSNVTDMIKVFYGCNSLVSLNLSNWNTENVTNMQGLFSGCNLLEQLDLKSFNTSNVLYINEMFMNCTSLTSLNLSSFDLSNASNIWDMFSNCKNLNTIYLNNTTLRSDMVISRTFYNVPNGFTIYVLDETSKNIILNVRSDANVIIQPLNT